MPTGNMRAIFFLVDALAADTSFSIISLATVMGK